MRGGPRKHEVDAVAGALAARRSVLITGDAGVGKSFIADEIASRCADDGCHVVRVRATAGSAELPFAAYAGHVTGTERFLTARLAELREQIVERAAGRPIVVVVDDVNLLDDASAALTHQLITHDGASLVGTARRGEVIPGEFDDLVRRGVLDRLVIEPFGEHDIAAVAGLTEDRTLAPESLALLHRSSGGNPLFVRELLLSAREEGRLVEGPHGVVLTGLPVAAARLSDVMRRRLGHLGDADRTALLHIAFAEPCGPVELAHIADATILARLERAGVVVADTDRSRLTIRLAHPLYGAVMRAGVGLLERRAVLGALAVSLEATGARRRGDVLKLGRLAADGGVSIDAGRLVDAATEAFQIGDYALCERIGRAAFARAGTWASAWHATSALTYVSTPAESRAQVEALRRLASTPAEIVATAMLDAEVAFWAEGDADTAIACHRAVPEELLADVAPGSGPVEPSDFRVSAASFLVAMVRLPETREVLAAANVDAPSAGFIRVSHTRSHASLIEARPVDALSEARATEAAFAAVGPWGATLSRPFVASHLSYAHTWGGDPERGLSAAIESAEASVDAVQSSLAAVARAMAEIWLGRPRSAAIALGTVAPLWTSVAAAALPVRWLHGLAALAHVSGGDLPAARSALAQYDAAAHPARSLDFLGELARARLMVAEGQLDDGRHHLRRWADECRAMGHVTGELTARYELVRLGNADQVVARLRELAPIAQGPLFAAFVDHAVEAAAGAADGLTAVSHRFEEMGYLELAADAAAQAGDAARRAGSPRGASRASVRAAELRARCESTGSPLATTVDVGPVPLTRRERDVAVLAAQGLASKEIGERLFISFRTAENHLAKVYDKLGVRSRAELARLLDGGVAGFVA